MAVTVLGAAEDGTAPVLQANSFAVSIKATRATAYGAALARVGATAV